ncbi:Uncharacterized conserved protein, DUF58 family, contains vWF domain [Fontimonas thermophila]|uniref:Uncharacterized conserved protein, DUF58 family, contains vWF domain n=1 Tax=Fontimonas thermophila TaxID=1076937 RepID=A0A1I2ITN8_9GAMM|nr:DUF58 domain-containing protein [Fontimonas thermophila]SFF44407.1 Uncharacterized conserved protein, DUF58 family, contains vWF domain [Fontimonas thermophila]
MRVWLITTVLLKPLHFVQNRIDAWVMARVRRQSGPITVARGRVYILPTRFGYAFALMLLAMLLGAMNYSNSMAFLLTFLLAGLGLVCMHHTHANLVNIQLRAGSCAPVFAGDIAHFEVRIDNPSAHPRYALALSWPKAEKQAITADVPARGSITLVLSLPTQHRGWLPAGVFSVSTEYPLGLFHAWTWAELDMRCLVFPRPAPGGIVPPATVGTNGLASGERSGQDEFAGLRSYRRGDAPRSIHWKSFPKLTHPVVKQFAETLEQELWLDWVALPWLDTEARLSQLTRWVLDAEAAQRSYGLRLPGRVIAPGRGDAHRIECLRALALYEDAQP